MYEQFRDGDFISRRFRRLGRRWWWAVLAVGVLGAVVLRWAVSPQYTAHIRFQVPIENSLLKSLDLVERTPNVFADVMSIQTKEFERATEDAISASLGVTIEAADYSVSIRLSSSSRTALINAADIFGETFLLSRKNNVARDLGEIKQNLEYSLKKIELRIREIETELAGIKDPSGSLAQALLFDRSTAATERTEISQKISAIESAISDVTIDVTKSQDIHSPSNSALRQFLPGASFGLFLAVIGLYVLACFDRKIRFRDDFIAATGAELLGVVTRSADNKTENRLTVAVRSILERRGDSEVVLSLVDDSMERAEGLERLRHGLEAVCSVRVDRTSNPKGDVAVHPGPVIFVAHYGRSTVSSVEQAARELSVLGRPLLGSVLIDVPAGELQRVLETPVSRFRFY